MLSYHFKFKHDIVLNVKPHMKSYLKLHPLNPNILLALFGNVALWDLNTGKKIFEDFDKVKFKSMNLINHKYIIRLFLSRVNYNYIHVGHQVMVNDL